jgi:hypothetical protein
MKYARARQFVEAVSAHEFEAAEEFLDSGVETVTPCGTLRLTLNNEKIVRIVVMPGGALPSQIE